MVQPIDRLKVFATSILRLSPHTSSSRFDDVRQRCIILVPERLLLPDEQAVEILQLVDGKTSAGAIIDAPRVATRKRLATHRPRRYRHAAGSRGQRMSRR